MSPGRRLIKILRVLTVDARRAWFAVLPLVILLMLPGLVTCDGEEHLRYAGLLLQLAGLGVVAKGISETRRLFDRPTIREAIRKWWAQLKGAFVAPSIRGSGNPTVDLQAFVSGAGVLSGSLTTQPSTVEGRLSELERADQELRQKLSDLSKQVTAVKSEIQSIIDDEKKQRAEDDLALKRLLEDQAAGGLHLETAGLIWLLVGTLVGSIPSELSGMVRMFPCLR